MTEEILKPRQSLHNPLYLSSPSNDNVVLRQSGRIPTWVRESCNARSAAHRTFCRTSGRPQTAAFGRVYFEPRKRPVSASESELRDCVSTLKASIGQRCERTETTTTRSSRSTPDRDEAQSHCTSAARRTPSRSGRSRSVKRPGTCNKSLGNDDVLLCTPTKTDYTDLDQKEDLAVDAKDDENDMLAPGDVDKTERVEEPDAEICQSANDWQMVVYHFVEMTSPAQNECLQNENENCGRENASPDRRLEIAEYSVEVRDDGRITPGLGTPGSPENQVLLDLLRSQLTLNSHHCLEDEQDQSEHWESLNRLVCRLVNAKPPADQLYYFAYGPDMSTERFATYIKRRPDDTSWALLYGFKMTVGCRQGPGRSSSWPTMEFRPRAAAQGRVYLITRQEAVLLDRHFGSLQGFQTFLLPIWLIDNNEDDCSVAQYCLPALVHLLPNVLQY